MVSALEQQSTKILSRLDSASHCFGWDLRTT
jgi:hypothetical protein